ncbi:Fe(3+)-siderophore ABC transporter permease [Amycolatopsis antarctica]|uniref:Fe(3+)-siderophore ABC transporter permease n=1 Tax=Amycolatopsis antarctica TaxID=1854586 RepID=A0A263D3N9_9PSEU|nr:iron chelate uptake ABC transporter family permease subunit [Amycolatopsis antarctica]OZM72066.1 Fe(3+)-siderophore ABC transporter permease [Amycolatopsis antarctica]
MVIDAPSARTRPGTGGTAGGARAAGLVLAVLALVLIALASVGLGFADISLGDTVSALLGNDGSVEAVTIREVRLPRVVLGMLVGAALGLAGALMQALTRNPLADPGLLGVTMGSSTAVVSAIAFLGVGSVTGHVWFAMGGAAVASALVYALGSGGRGLHSPERLVLAGAAVTAVLLAFNSAVLLLDPRAFDEFRFWNIGSLAGRQTDVLGPVTPFIVAAILLALPLSRALNAVALGDDTGRALGVNLTTIRALSAVAVTVLCGAATAAAGPILFIGLAVPQVARMIAGPDHRWILPYSVVLAPMLMVGADTIGRLVIAPDEMQVGIVTAFLGAPVFIALCLRRKLTGA